MYWTEVSILHNMNTNGMLYFKIVDVSPANVQLFYNLKRTVYNRSPPRRYPFFDVMVGLEWPHDPDGYAGGSVCYW